MQVLERLIDADTFLELVELPEYRDREYELINGEMVEKPMAGDVQGDLAGEIYGSIFIFLRNQSLGKANFEVDYRSAVDRFLVLRPDVAYISYGRAPKPPHYGAIPRMPDLAVEVASPSNTVRELREKAAIYLRNETQLVWLVFPRQRRVEVHRADGSVDALSADDALSGEAVLPGFTLELRELFSLLGA